MVRVQTGSYVAVDRQTTYLVGSGTTAILAIARTISRKRIQFKSHVELVAFVRLTSSPFPSLISCPR